jgi:3-hydroxybutyryl-CoA dehydrogenase
LQISKVAIIGGGTMGSGIAIVTAKAGFKTILIDKTQELAQTALENIYQEIDAQIARWGMTDSEKKFVQANLETTEQPGKAKEAQLIICAVPDKLELKKQVFSHYDAICADNTIFTSISSVLSVTELATVLERPEKMLGLHFLNPVFKTQVVEIVRGFKTSDDTFQTGKAFVSALGKQGVEIIESPGFVTTRLIVPLLNEAMYALMEGVASAEDVDLAMKLGYGMQVGPLELADRMGLETLLNLMNHLFRETGELKFRPCPLIKKLVRAQHLGVKTGEGFFTYDSKTGKRIRQTKAKLTH